MPEVKVRTNVRVCRRCFQCEAVLLEAIRACDCPRGPVQDGVEWVVYVQVVCDRSPSEFWWTEARADRGVWMQRSFDPGDLDNLLAEVVKEKERSTPEVRQTWPG